MWQHNRSLPSQLQTPNFQYLLSQLRCLLPAWAELSCSSPAARKSWECSLKNTLVCTFSFKEPTKPSGTRCTPCHYNVATSVGSSS